MTKTKKKSAASKQEPEPAVLRTTLLAMQVCVPKKWTYAKIAEWANGVSPTGISSKWQVCRKGNSCLVGNPPKVRCEEREGCVHVVLEC